MIKQFTVFKNTGKFNLSAVSCELMGINSPAYACVCAVCG